MKQETAPMITVTVHDMLCRHDAREISAYIADLAGVLTLEADAVSRTVRVTGDVTIEAVRAAIAAAGFDVS